MINTPAKKFLQRFVNNSDTYALQNSDGGYYPHRGTEISNAVFLRHLLGDVTLGIYNINPIDNTSKWLCWDLDDEQEEKLEILIRWLRDHGFNSLRESVRSGRSGHLWLFFDRAIPSEYVYRLAFHARFIAGLSCEIFPKQASLREGQLGNLVRMPLGVHRKTSAGGVRGLFKDCPSPDIRDQLFWFLEQETTNADKLIELAQTLPVPQTHKPKKKRKQTGQFKQLIDEFPEEWPWQERAGGELIGLCPKCYEDGHDKQENNLSLNTERNILRCHYDFGAHTFEEIMLSLRNYKKEVLQ